MTTAILNTIICIARVVKSSFEFSSEELARLRNAVAETHQFLAQSHRLIVSGICFDCRSKRGTSRHQDRV